MTMAIARRPPAAPGIAPWRMSPPVLSGDVVTIREVTGADAASLLKHLNAPAVARHITPPPATLESFRRFVRWSRIQRRKGTCICFAVVPAGESTPVGIVQIWKVDPDFDVAEWGILIGEQWWGHGIATAAAQLLFDFAFHIVGAIRLEARCASENHGARAFMKRLGATHEGTLRDSARRHDKTITDQDLWAVFPETFQEAFGGQAARQMAEC